jgi:Zn-dependent protease with chaperone function
MDRTSQIVVTFLANALWGIPLLALATVCCERLGRRRLPARRGHLLWVAALVLSVGLPLLSPQFTHEPGQLYFSFADPSAALANPARTIPALVAWLRGFVSQHPQPLLVSGWFTGLVAYVYVVFLFCGWGRLWVGYRRSQRICRGVVDKTIPRMFGGLMQRARRDLGVPIEPLLRVSAHEGPMTCGIRRPVIVLPQALLAETSPTVITSILGHELAHVRRHDFLLNLFYELLFVPISFHPAAWFIKRRLEQTRELACDEMVAGPIVDVQSYVKSLFSVIRSQSLSRAHGCGLGVGDTERLQERFRAILSPKSRNQSTTTIFSVALVILGTVSLAIASFSMTIVPVEPLSSNTSAISISHARETAIRYLPGEVVGEEIRRKDGTLLYSFYIRTKTGISEVYIKASSGEVASVTPAENEAEEKK